MAKYRAIHTKIYTDPKFQQLDQESRYLFIYLLTNPHLTESGLYTLTFATASFESGIDQKRIKNTFERLIESGLVRYDIKNHVVWIVNYLKYQRPNGKVVVSINHDLKHLADSFLAKALFQRYHQFIDGLLAPHSQQAPSDTHSNGYPDMKSTPDTPCNGYPDLEFTPDTHHIGVGVGVGVEIGKEGEGVGEGEKISEKSESGPTPDTVPKELTPETLVATWNTITADKRPSVVEITDSRRKKIRLRLAEHPDLEFWESVFRRVVASGFLMGNGGRESWTGATFDWIVTNDSNSVRIAEGNYDNRGRSSPEEPAGWGTLREWGKDQEVGK